jgi:hypothetical protein
MGFVATTGLGIGKDMLDAVMGESTGEEAKGSTSVARNE